MAESLVGPSRHFWLPRTVRLPNNTQLSADLCVWLTELRHLYDFYGCYRFESSESECDGALSSDNRSDVVGYCDSVGRYLQGVSVQHNVSTSDIMKPDVHKYEYLKHKRGECEVNMSTECQNAFLCNLDNVTWKANPLYSSTLGGLSTNKSIFKQMCEEALNCAAALCMESFLPRERFSLKSKRKGVVFDGDFADQSGGACLNVGRIVSSKLDFDLAFSNELELNKQNLCKCLCHGAFLSPECKSALTSAGNNQIPLDRIGESVQELLVLFSDDHLSEEKELFRLECGVLIKELDALVSNPEVVHVNGNSVNESSRERTALDNEFSSQPKQTFRKNKREIRDKFTMHMDSCGHLATDSISLNESECSVSLIQNFESFSSSESSIRWESPADGAYLTFDSHRYGSESDVASSDVTFATVNEEEFPSESVYDILTGAVIESCDEASPDVRCEGCSAVRETGSEVRVRRSSVSSGVGCEGCSESGARVRESSVSSGVGCEGCSESEARVRKSSVSSDVVAWKRDIFFNTLDDSDEDYFIIMGPNKDEWFSSSDNEGRVYFFEENSNESSWTLPEPVPLNNNNKTSEEEQKDTQSHQSASVAVPLAVRNLNRTAKSRSMVLTDRSEPNSALPQSVPRNWPQLWDGHMCVLKEGPLNRTKITENGKRLRKNWAAAHVVLTELFLLFFKDSKSFAAMKSSGARPELCVDLNGALIDRGDKVSSRKNVYVLSTVLGLQVLIQGDDHNIAEQWLAAIQLAIKNLPLGFDNSNRGLKGSKDQSRLDPVLLDEPKKGSRIGRSKSVKLKHKDESMEDLSVSPADRQIKIRERLKKFFHRRPTMESLVKKGIWKDEPVFGCYLEQVCGADFPRVPVFVQKCIQCIEQSEENMKTDGLYRASGNLSQVQKIRLQVDQNNYVILEQEEDVHVLTGALKLFFRELKQPLLPFHFFNKALKASTNHNRKEKLKDFREIVKALPMPNHDTLKFLLQHLLRVTKYQDCNRMHIPNLAIVFGPTLMWSEQESLNMALDLMQQNLVIECFLAEFDQIFR